MAKRWLWVVAAMIAGAGCATARIVDSDVIGPDGGHLVKLECEARDQCAALARQACGGDFDVVNNEVSWGPSSRTPPGSTDVMLVRCKSAAGVAPGHQPAGPLDAFP